MAEIDNVQLISLVEARPVLWDNTLDVYKGRIATRNAWREVCNELNSKFEELEDWEKNMYRKEVTRRWTNLRDAFSKSRKKIQSTMRSGAGATTVRKYIFNDQMQFLLKCYESRDTSDTFDNSSENIAFQSTEDVDIQLEFAEGEVAEETIASRTQTLQRIANKKRRKPDEIELRMLKAMEQPDEKPDHHMSFFYSLLPHVRKFNDNDTLEFQMNVLQAITKINEKRRLATEVNCRKLQ